MNREAVEDKAINLADKINEISKKFDIAQEVITTDAVTFVEDSVRDISNNSINSNAIPTEELVNLDNMIQDFKFVRDTLTENIDNGRRVLTAVTLDLLDASEDSRHALITAFSELNNAIANNLKLYTNSYKEISAVLINLQKLKATDNDTPSSQSNRTTNNLIIQSPKSTAEIIEQLKLLK